MITSELWAWSGLAASATPSTPSVVEQATEPGVEFTREVVEALVRAAYSVGYVDALKDDEPLTYADAMARRDQLHLMLPVT